VNELMCEGDEENKRSESTLSGSMCGLVIKFVPSTREESSSVNGKG
jgi:hypothetical protein